MVTQFERHTIESLRLLIQFSRKSFQHGIQISFHRLIHPVGHLLQYIREAVADSHCHLGAKHLDSRTFLTNFFQLAQHDRFHIGSLENLIHHIGQVFYFTLEGIHLSVIEKSCRNRTNDTDQRSHKGRTHTAQKAADTAGQIAGAAGIDPRQAKSQARKGSQNTDPCEKTRQTGPEARIESPQERRRMQILRGIHSRVYRHRAILGNKSQALLVLRPHRFQQLIFRKLRIQRTVVTLNIRWIILGKDCPALCQKILLRRDPLIKERNIADCRSEK